MFGIGEKSSTAAVGVAKSADLKEVKNKNSGAPSFEQTLNDLGKNDDKNLGEAADKKMSTSPKDVMAKEIAKSDKPILKFSNHALERMNTRGISFSPEQITKIEQGMQKAQDKGAKETLVLTDDSAMIVSLKNNTVVTVMDKAMMKENVFTNIDSTVFV